MTTRTTNIVVADGVRDADAHRPEDGMLTWLLQGDPAIRWQVLRDLCDGADEVVHAERQAVAEVGWGARLLALQDDDGKWAGALYSPKNGPRPPTRCSSCTGLASPRDIPRR